MARGIARLLGFNLILNFNNPYLATGLGEFWTRWHISLSSWFRDYVYIPLGGNRKGPRRTYVNLGIIFVLTGLWHGANWTFLVWGVFHGACVIVERLTGQGVFEHARLAPLRRLVTFALVCIGWAVFRAADLGQAGNFIGAMLWPQGLDIPSQMSDVITTQRLVWFAIGLSVVAMPAGGHLGRRISSGIDRASHAVRVATVVIAAPIACVYALSSSFSPFLYFQF
jgi:alginate O-acetyltransferase complex protein AlgI